MPVEADAAAVEAAVLKVELLDEDPEEELVAVAELESLVVDAAAAAAAADEEEAATLAADSTDGRIEVTSVKMDNPAEINTSRGLDVDDCAMLWATSNETVTRLIVEILTIFAGVSPTVTMFGMSFPSA